jgi:Na+-transporting methylmalonyl-CoA/oxaloacetate decarboxylase gamma subunit
MSTMLDWIGVIAALVVLWLAVRYLGRFLSWVERSEIARQKAEAAAEAARRKSAASPAAASVAAPREPEGVPADHVVAIAAAVAAYGFRVIHIADAATGNAWASEGRWLHQTSHRRI